MESNNTIYTLYEFTEKGYEEVLAKMEKLLRRQKELRQQWTDQNTTGKALTDTLNKLTEEWMRLDKSMNKDSTRKEREGFAELKKNILSTQATIMEVNDAKRANTKEQEANTKAIKSASNAEKAYVKVLEELKKGIDNADVSIDALTKAKKALDKEMKSKGINGENYIKLSENLAMVKSVIKDTEREQRAAVKTYGAAENSVAALKVRIDALKASWEKMDPNSEEWRRTADEIKRMTDQVSKAEQEIGVFSRNVGNYRSHWDGLGFSVQQVVRELPAFAISMNTGILAVSNNIPILIDHIKMVCEENKKLVAEGKKAQSVLKQIGKSLISWQTLLIIGISLLSKYADKLVDWIKGLRTGAKEAEIAKKTLESLNEAFQNNTKTAGENIAKYEELRQKWIALGNSFSTKRQFLKDNTKDFEDLGVAVTTVKDVENLLIENTDNYVRSQQKRALADAYRAVAAEKFTEWLEKYTEQQDKILAGNGEVNPLSGMFKQNKQDLLQWEHDVLKTYKSTEAIISNASDLFSNELANTGEKLQDRALSILKESATEEYKEISDLLAKASSLLDESMQELTNAGLKLFKRSKETADKTTAAYMQAISERMKAEEGLLEAQLEGNKEEEILRQKDLENKKKAEEKAKKEAVNIKQEEKDEIELIEYEHGESLKKIRTDYEKKQHDAYLSAVDGVREAQKLVFEAERSGNKEQLANYRKLLAQRQAALEKFDEEQIKLTEGDRLDQEIKQQEMIDAEVERYRTLKERLLQIEMEYQQATTSVQQKAAKKQMDEQEKLVDQQAGILAQVGVNAETVTVKSAEATEKTTESTMSQLQKALETIEQYGGKGNALFGSLATGVAAFGATISEVNADLAKMDETEGKAAAEKEGRIKKATAAAVMLTNTFGAVAGAITSGLEQQLASIDKMYDAQEKRMEKHYDLQQKELDTQLEKGQISEARYALEKIKLEDEQAEKEEKIAQEKANKEYAINLKMFRINQAKDAAQAAIATALAVMTTLGETGFFGTPLIPIITALGAAQVAMIWAQKAPEKPKFAKGGYLGFEEVDGPSHDNGGVPVSIGGKKVAEVEGGEGAIIVSKKAMKNKDMRSLLQRVIDANRRIADGEDPDDVFEDGGYLSYDYFYDKALRGLEVTKKRKRSVRVNGKKYKIKKYGGSVDMLLEELASDEAKEEYNKYREQETGKLEEKLNASDAEMNRKISESAEMQKYGITTIAQYNEVVAAKEDAIKSIEDEIKAFEDLKNARLDALKAEMDYDNTIADFDRQKEEAEQELADKTLEVNKRMLSELLAADQISQEEYMSLLDQVTKGYGANTSDIIALKRKEVEAIKALIEEQRQAEVNAANEVADYRKKALEQLREEWQNDYNDTTSDLLENISEANEAVSKLTGTDLERYRQVLEIQKEIDRLNDDYAKNESILTDGVIQSREEQARLVAEQKRIQEELAVKEKEAEEAKAAFEEERNKNMESAMKAFETANFDNLLEQIKSLGAELQEEGNKWSLDKQITADLEAQLKSINATYDEQIAQQDKIVNGIETEIERLELLRDQRLANIGFQEEAFKKEYEARKKIIEDDFTKMTANLSRDLNVLEGELAAIKVAGVAVGIEEYNRLQEKLKEEINSMPERYAAGGAISLGGGNFRVEGPSHANGGVPLFVGDKQIAEVEGDESLFVLNKRAAEDRRVKEMLAQMSYVNRQYGGAPLVPDYNPSSHGTFELDYDLLAEKIGRQINMRPTRSYIAYGDMSKAVDVRNRVRQRRRMA